MTGRIVRAAIHPAIGIARVGNSEEHFLAPQVVKPTSRPTRFYHDANGALKREAIAFRIYGYDADGAVVAEITADNARIAWSAHLANFKSQWYKFRAAMDLPQAGAFSMQRRNPNYDPSRRGALGIDPGPRHISGRGVSGDPRHAFDTGRFEGVPVYLGELRTDPLGRLLVLGGRGTSASPSNQPVYVPSEIDSFANASGWYDDTSDGPVWAEVEIDGRPIPTEAAWAVVTPPNYAPDIVGWRTLYDVLHDLFVDAGWLREPTEVSFTRDIHPLLERMTNLQWVSKGFAAMFGAGGPLDFSDPDLIDKICRVHGGRADVHQQLRRQITNAFRPRGLTSAAPRDWPWIYGDAFGTFPDGDPDNHLALPDSGGRKLKRWAKGDFIADWGTATAAPSRIEDVPLAEQPAMLDKAPLHFCLADAFHPGCELTWPMRHLSIFSKPFRIKWRQSGPPPDDYGDFLTPARIFQAGGPLEAQGPGELTRWMAVPWQVDTAGCRSGYDETYDPFLPTFWPARVPNHVLTEENYRIVMDASRPLAERQAAFHERRTWYHPLEGRGGDQMTLMVSMFASLGVIEARPGPQDAGFPDTIYVERLPPSLAGLAPDAIAVLPGHPRVPVVTPDQIAARLAGWESVEQREFFRRARFPR